jgi:hypothetical protein
MLTFASVAASNKARAARGGGFRAHARRNVRLRAMVTHIEHGWQKHAEVENLGLGGACIVLPEALAVGEKISLSFVAPTLWDPLVLRARIIWTDSSRKRAGVAFEHKSAQATFALFELVATMAYDA